MKQPPRWGGSDFPLSRRRRPVPRVVALLSSGSYPLHPQGRALSWAFGTYRALIRWLLWPQGRVKGQGCHFPTEPAAPQLCGAHAQGQAQAWVCMCGGHSQGPATDTALAMTGWAGERLGSWGGAGARVLGPAGPLLLLRSCPPTWTSSCCPPRPPTPRTCTSSGSRRAAPTGRAPPRRPSPRAGQSLCTAL